MVQRVESDVRVNDYTGAIVSFRMRETRDLYTCSGTSVWAGVLSF